ncbi:PREDICTED: synaptojanin-2-binding protein-like [Nipponia nippon]|uniref:synaptojanin-2-binding protein-like n=1 Tax=Nipponia nippon TaxID=128390 RepID=UPI00051085D1|nr:PREDICTED: synaptojanin-2-binding protein-like [Nipponia nippon]
MTVKSCCLPRLGFNIVGGTDQQYISNDSSIYVSRIKKDGAAYLDGRLQEGDKILAVNGRDLKDLRHKDAVELFRNAGYDVSLKIQRRLQPQNGPVGHQGDGESGGLPLAAILVPGLALAAVDPALKEKLKQNTVTLESEYEKLEKSDLDKWENIRGPSLWEDSRTVQKQRREALRLKTE